ncbi:hypothetical protein [Mucilaginibacter pedocola]|uniref:Uncharacterized protein n=1 Tax=Mucilaginibacter pedocola TaxID=1792845 RepID=A0A1S9PBP0_9SPHI|nr:hypothetical protein [Mucilaginibacter pedocola]OOQ58217.1 hypothetical protein BC343_11270 [Mucilaginibacter pedocola]
MDHYREIKNNLTWHNEGKFEVELTNGVITRLNFWEPGKGPEDEGKCLTSTNYKYLQAVHSALGDLFTFIDEENKRLGYSYARPMEPGSYNEEVVQTPYKPAAEAKLRPVLNYDSNPELSDISVGEGLRDIG